MSAPLARLAKAELDREIAKGRFDATVEELRVRLDPKTLAKTTARNVADGSASAVRAGIDTVQDKPGVIAGVVAVAGLFLARHRIAALFSREKKHEPKKVRNI